MKIKNKELNLFSITWMGFSFIAGITFTASFTTILGKDSVGGHIYWIFALEGLIAFMCAWAFGKLVQVHPQANGGGSQYARTAFGKFWGLLMGMLNYSVIPLVGMNLLVSMVRQNFDGGAVDLVGFKNGVFTGSWGSWGSLYLDIIAFGLFIFASTVIFFGIRKYKVVGVAVGYITWTLTLLLMILGLVAGGLNLFGSNPNNGLLNHTAGIKLGFKNFSSAFTTCFLAYGGIETFITTGKNIKNRSKNVPLAIIIILIATTLFYIIFTLIIMFAVTGDFKGNPNLQIFENLSNNVIIKKFGVWMIIACTLLMRFNSSLQLTLFGGSTLEPLAKQRFIPKKLEKENGENVPINGVITTIIISILTSVLFIFIPDIIQGVTGKSTPFDYATLASAASIVLISIYYLIIPVVLVQGFRKKIKLKIWEYIGWILTMGVLTFIIVMYFIDLFSTLANPYKDGVFLIQPVLASTFQLVYLFAIILVALYLYFVYHKKQMKLLSTNKEELEKLQEYEKVFVIFEKDTIIKNKNSSV